MIPESVKARIEKDAEIKFTTNHLSTTGFIAMPMAQQRAYISGATVEYERGQVVIEALKSCLSFIEELKKHGVTQWSGEISAKEVLKLYKQ